MGRAAVVGRVLGVLLLAGCTAQAQEPPGLTASPTGPTASPTATASPTPESNVQDLSDPALGIVFEDVPVLTADAGDVYNLAATFQLEYWRTMSTNTVSPAFSVLASAEEQATMNRIATNNSANGAMIGGTFRTRVADVLVDGDTATATACDDYTDVTFESPAGPDTPESAGFGSPRHKTLTLQRFPEGLWRVMTVEVAGTC